MLEGLAKLLLWYTGKLIQHPYCGIPALLVSGVGRSGTTALRMSLGLHPAIAYNMSENNIVMDLLAAGLHNCTYPSRKTSMQMSPGRYDRVFRNLFLSLLYPRPPLFHRAPRFWMAHSDINPTLATYLKQLFPGLRIVYIVRNGIEVVASRMLFEGFKDRPFQWQCETWAKAATMVRWGQAQDHFFLVRHERLLGQVGMEQTFSELWAFLNLPPAQRCLDALLNDFYHPTKSQEEGDLASANLAERNQRWRFWDATERQCFTDTCAEAMKFLGYDLPWKGPETAPQSAPSQRTDDNDPTLVAL